VSVVSLPRRDVVTPRTAQSPTRPRVRPATRTPSTTKRAARGRHVTTQGRLASISVLKKSVAIVAVAIILALFGSMLETNRQVELHQLQSDVLQDQSSYATQVGSLTNLSAPSIVVSQANALHLVNPISVTQVPATSLDAILPLPHFTGYAPVTSRTQR
jgi:hypothetical protein